MSSKKIALLFVVLSVAFRAVAQDAAASKSDKWLAVRAGLQFGSYKFTDGSLYGSAPFDRVLAPEIGLSARVQFTKTVHLALSASYWSRSMSSDGQFVVPVAGLGSQVFYVIDGRQPFIGSALGAGASVGLRNGLRPYVEAGAVLDFPLAETVAQTEHYFGFTAQNDLQASESAFGGYLEAGVFVPFGNRWRLEAGGRWTGTAASASVFETVQSRPISVAIGYRRWALSVGLARRF